MPHNIGSIESERRKDSHECPWLPLADRLYECLNDHPGKWEEIAAEIGVDVSLLSHWTSHRGPVPAWRLIGITKVLGPGFLRWIAQRCGYDLVRIEKAPESPRA